MYLITGVKSIIGLAGTMGIDVYDDLFDVFSDNWDEIDTAEYEQERSQEQRGTKRRTKTGSKTDHKAAKHLMVEWDFLIHCLVK